jgi:serine/threonine protein kinase
LLFESVLGKGAYGRVYRALNKENGKFLAVKVISLNLHSKSCKSTLGKLGKLYCRTGDFVASEARSS